MEAKLKDKQAVEATIEVTVAAAEVDQTYETVLRALARQVKVPGFRPGKAPRGVLVKRVGRDALEQEVREAIIDANYPKAMQEFELNPVHVHFHGGNPSEGSDFTFEVHADLFPEITLPDLDEIVIDSAAPEIDDAMVTETVRQLQRENATLVPVERPVQPGDYLLVETVAAEGDEGESGSTMPIDLETVGDELAEQLLGASIGDVVELKLARPTPAPEADEVEGDSAEGAVEADADAPETPTLKVRVSDIKEKDKPKPDDEFAKTLGFDSWQETEKAIRDSLRSRAESEAFEEQREEFIDKLLAETDFDVPGSLVNRRKLNLLENLAEDLRKRNLTLEGYFASLEEKGNREEFESELQETAERGVRRDLVLERLMEVRGTELANDEFKAALQHLAAREGKDLARFMRERDEDWLRNYRFLLTRDKALREVLRERLGGQAESEAAPAEAGSAADDEG